MELTPIYVTGVFLITKSVIENCEHKTVEKDIIFRFSVRHFEKITIFHKE